MAAGLIRFVATVAVALLSHASPLAAEEPVVIQLGPATFSVPESWVDPGWSNAVQNGPTETVLLTVPTDRPSPLDFKVDVTGIDTVSILLHHDAEQLGQHGAFMALAGAREIGIASPTDAAKAFNGIVFDTLYGGEAATAGKSATAALYLVGLVPRGDQMLVVGAKLNPETDAHAGGQYIIALPLASGGADFQALITLTAFRRLQPDDLTWVDATEAILEDRLSF
jgi:hypothetical protein